MFGLVVALFERYTVSIPFSSGLALVIRARDNYVLILRGFNVYYVSEANTKLTLFSFINISANQEPLKFYSLESMFDFEAYLRNKGVKYALNDVNYKILFLNPLPNLRFKSYAIRGYNKEVSAFLNMLLFNETSEDNLLFYLSISGFHFSLIRQGLRKLLALFTSERKAELVSNLSLILFLLVLPLSFSFIRILIFGLLSYINKYKWGNYFIRLELLSISALFFLILSPRLATNPSFYYAYPLSILLSLLPYRLKKKRLYMSGILLLYFLPIIIYQTGKYDVFVELLKLLISPVLPFIFIFAFLSFFFPFVKPLVSFLTTITIKVINFTSRFSFSLIMGSPSLLWLICFFIVAFILLRYISQRNQLGLKYLSLTLLVLLLFTFLPFNNLFSVDIYFINVGQGDSALIQSSTETTLIDTGGSFTKDIGREVLIPFFKKKGIRKIDHTLITHNDFDHNGALSSLQEEKYVKNLYTEANQFPILLSFFTIYNLNHEQFDNDNENSLIFYFQIKDFSFLLMGDATISNEETLILNYPHLEVSHLKVGHHGSSTSTSEQFIAHYKPKEAIISVGQNYYGHPSPSVITTLKSHNVNIRITREEGTIHYKVCIIKA